MHSEKYELNVKTLTKMTSIIIQGAFLTKNGWYLAMEMSNPAYNPPCQPTSMPCLPHLVRK